MTRTITVWLAAALVLLGAPAALATSQPASVVGGVGSCTTSKGALVAVDFAHWGGPKVRGCGTTLTTGRALLTSAKFTLTNVARYPAFLCRIGHPKFSGGTQYPKPAQDACVNTPPASAFWSFWTAKKGVNTWTLSPKGADSDVPVNGEVEAWTYGAGAKPTFTPNTIRAGLPAAVQARPAAAPAATPDAAAGAAYLVGKLVGGTHVEFDGGFGPDYGGTADVALALAGTGTQDAALVRVLSYEIAHVADYADPDGTGQFPGPYSGAAGKLALLAEITGQDPHAFGGFDLLKTLTDHVCTAPDTAGACTAPGDFYQAFSAVSQALAVLALERGGVTVPPTALARLLSLQCSDGGFSSVLIKAGDPCTSDVDTTGFAVQALVLEPSAAASVTRAVAYLRGGQTPGGGWTGTAGTNSNSTALAVQGLLAAPATDATAVSDGLAFLAGLQNSSDGGFGISSGTPASDTRATTQAVLAAARRTLTTLSHPVSVGAPPSSTPPSSTPPTSTPPSTSAAPTTPADPSPGRWSSRPHSRAPPPVTDPSRRRPPACGAGAGGHAVPGPAGAPHTAQGGTVCGAGAGEHAVPRPAAAPHTRRRRAGTLAAVAVLLASLFLGDVAGAPAAGADPLSSCTTTRGAIVAVDFGHWSGPVVRGCGANPSSGAALLAAAGFSVTRVGRFPAFVCRLGQQQFAGGTQYPRPSDDSCANTPPADAYWAYWTAKPGDSGWTYSSTSVDGDRPVGGEVELWQFGSGSRPSISPDALRSHTVSAPPTHATSHASSTRPSGSGARSTAHSSVPGRSTAAATSGRPSTSARTSAVRTTAAVPSTAGSTAGSTAASTTGPAASAASAAPTVVDATTAASRKKSDDGSATPLLIGLLVVLVLGGGAGFVALRNRRA